MATDDCYEFGRGPCPCGNGVIIVERCIPDHPWAKPHQAWYRNTIDCDKCSKKYSFYKKFTEAKSTVVLTSDKQASEDAAEKWHEKTKEIEESPKFQELVEKLNRRLALERSAAARHRLLTQADMAFGISLPRYRKEGYKLSVSDARAAVALLGFQSSKLEAKLAEAERLWNICETAPPSIKTGVNGLKM